MIDEESLKHLNINIIRCTCGKDIKLISEIVNKNNESQVIQFIVRCSDESCGRSGMIWNNQLLYLWD